jgi:hypothetical protein
MVIAFWYLINTALLFLLQYRACEPHQKPNHGLQTAIGHWLEHLLPLVSALREERKFSLHRVLILHLKRVHVFEWVRAALAAALDVAPGTNLPPIFMQREVDSVHQQIGKLIAS